jgi:3-oxoacyl-[acyl-carrier protein] reductase
MTDFLVKLGTNPRARRLIRSLGLPLPLPEKLRRDIGPWQARPLAEMRVIVGAAAGAELTAHVARSLSAAGATAYAVSSDVASAGLAPLHALGETSRVRALVFDASGVGSIGGLRALYDFFHPLLARLDRSARVVVLGRPVVEARLAEAAAARRALNGFVRSVAKEIGRNGSTANLVVVDQGAETRIDGVLRFLLSARSAFVTAQPLVVTARARELSDPAFVRPLDKKVALVTGAARGIGAATARLLAQEGAHVVCVDRPSDEATTRELARELGGTAVLVDLAESRAAEDIAVKIHALGGVDVVVNNAGITRDKTLARMEERPWQEVLDVNLAAVVRLAAALEPELHDDGRILCLSSVAGLAGNVGQTAYAASKAGVAGWVSARAEELAERGVTVNAVAPGFIETRLTAAIPLAIREAGRRLSALAQGGQPEDVAQAIVFLASPGAQGITGETLRVCGGALIGA